jgi:hypothetical protein
MHNLVEYSPFLMGITAIYLASKVEEFYLTVLELLKKLDLFEGLANVFSEIEEKILKAEVALLQALNFQIKVVLLHRVAYGFFSQINIESKELQSELWLKAQLAIGQSIMGDFLLEFSPTLVCLACLFSALPHHQVEQLKSIASSTIPKDRLASFEQTLAKAIQCASSDLNSKEQPDQDAIKKIVSSHQVLF